VGSFYCTGNITAFLLGQNTRFIFTYHPFHLPYQRAAAAAAVVAAVAAVAAVAVAVAEIPAAAVGVVVLPRLRLDNPATGLTN